MRLACTNIRLICSTPDLVEMRATTTSAFTPVQFSFRPALSLIPSLYLLSRHICVVNKLDQLALSAVCLSRLLSLSLVFVAVLRTIGEERVSQLPQQRRRSATAASIWNYFTITFYGKLYSVPRIIPLNALRCSSTIEAARSAGQKQQRHVALRHRSRDKGQRVN